MKIIVRKHTNCEYSIDVARALLEMPDQTESCMDIMSLQTNTYLLASCIPV